MCWRLSAPYTKLFIWVMSIVVTRLSTYRWLMGNSSPNYWGPLKLPYRSDIRILYFVWLRVFCILLTLLDKPHHWSALSSRLSGWAVKTEAIFKIQLSCSMGLRDYLISARFLTTIGHITNVFLLFATIENNIEVSLGDGASTAQQSLAYRSSIAALVFSIVCFAVDFSGLILGTSLFNPTVRQTLSVPHPKM